MIAAHPEVFSFPETHYFRKIWGRAWRIRRLGLLSPRAAARALDLLLADLRWRRDRPSVPPFWPFFERYGHTFITTVDRACSDAGKSVWVEKSPIHLHCQDQIGRVAPDARFIHIVRDGSEVVASMFDLCVRDPNRWVGQVSGRLRKRSRQGRILDRGELLSAVIDRWNTDVRLTLATIGSPEHHLVRYEELVRDPEGTLREACAFLGLPFDDSMLQYQDVARVVIGRRSTMDHMQGPLEPLNVRAGKSSTVLTAQERAAVAARLIGGGDISACFSGAGTETPRAVG
jgi:hypothetical protein